MSISPTSPISFNLMEAFSDLAQVKQQVLKEPAQSYLHFEIAKKLKLIYREALKEDNRIPFHLLDELTESIRDVNVKLLNDLKEDIDAAPSLPLASVDEIKSAIQALILKGYIKPHRYKNDLQAFESSLSRMLEHSKQQQEQEDLAYPDGLKLDAIGPSLPSKLIETTDGMQAIALCCGLRAYMEDRAVCTPLKGLSPSEIFDCFAVIDGHAGSQCADIVKGQLHHFIAAALEFCPSEEERTFAISKALKTAFEALHILYVRTHQELRDGACVLATLKNGGDLWIANTGDSRAVLVTDLATTTLSYDARGERALYGKTIAERGSWVEFAEGAFRVEGQLMPARAMGDAQVIGMVARPKITHISLKESIQGAHFAYLILGTDGLFDAITSSGVGNIVRRLKEAPDMTVGKIAKELMQSAIQNGSTDNVTVLVADLIESKAKMDS